MRPPGRIEVKAKGFKAFASVQGKGVDLRPNRGLKQAQSGQWYGWQKEPLFKTGLYDTRAEAKEALLRDAPKER